MDEKREIENYSEITGIGIDITEEDVRLCIAEFCEREGIEDMRKAPQTIFSACMTYIGVRLFGRRIGGKRSYFWAKRVDSTGKLASGVGYDDDKIAAATQFYIDICRLYDKVSTLGGLCAFLGIEKGYFKKHPESQAREMIYDASEDTAGEVLIGGKRPPMSVLPYLNHFHGWARDVSEQGQQAERGVKALPDLSRYLPNKDG